MKRATDVKPLLQPDASGLCGQTCVAMAAGVTIDEAFNAVGVSGIGQRGTEPSDLVRGLRRLGVRVGEPRPFPQVRLPRCGIAAINDNKTSWGHWVFLKNGLVYDPGFGYPLPVRVYEMLAIEMAFSRRYERSRDASKRVKACWGTFVPVYSRRKP